MASRPRLTVTRVVHAKVPQQRQQCKPLQCQPRIPAAPVHGEGDIAVPVARVFNPQLNQALEGDVGLEGSRRAHPRR